MLEERSPARSTPKQDGLYQDAATAYAGALERLAWAYEADADRRRDLVQEIHLALWQSFAGFDGRCSLRTWVYRVAHNVAASHVMRERARSRGLVGLDTLEHMPGPDEGEATADRRHVLQRLLSLIQQLRPIDRQVILSYLEGMDAASIGEITGLSPGNVATRVHRIKNILGCQFREGTRHDE